jgi:hypothetical protein
MNLKYFFESVLWYAVFYFFRLNLLLVIYLRNLFFCGLSFSGLELLPIDFKHSLEFTYPCQILLFLILIIILIEHLPYFLWNYI